MTSPNAGFLNRYTYDPLDRLVSFGVEQGTAERRFYNNKRLATQIQGDSTFSVFQHDDLLLGQHRYGFSHDAVLLATDVQRSVIGLLSAQGNNGLVYSPYGHCPAQNGMMSLLGFNGEKFDPVTGHYLLGNGHRAFNPVLMRFNSPDRLSPFYEGGFNAYAYCSGNPIGRVDPDGRNWFRTVYKSYKNLYGLSINAVGYHEVLKRKRDILTPGLSPRKVEKTRRRLNKDLYAIDRHLAKKNEKLMRVNQSHTDVANGDFSPGGYIGGRNIQSRVFVLEEKISRLGMMRDVTNTYLGRVSPMRRQSSIGSISSIVGLPSYEQVISNSSSYRAVDLDLPSYESATGPLSGNPEAKAINIRGGI